MQLGYWLQREHGFYLEPAGHLSMCTLELRPVVDSGCHVVHEHVIIELTEGCGRRQGKESDYKDSFVPGVLGKPVFTLNGIFTLWCRLSKA